MAWDWSSVGSILATLLFLRTAYRDFLPPELHSFISFLLRSIGARLNNDAKIVIDEYDATSSANELYSAANVYLGARCLDDAAVVCLTKRHDSPLPAASLPSCHTTHDSFRGIPLRWSSVAERDSYSHPFRGRSSAAQHRSLELTFHRCHSHVVRSAYIHHVLEEAERITSASRERHLFTNRAAIFGDDYCSLWTPVPFSHPSTFDTLAIDPALRDDIRQDLLRFVARRDYYARVGRAWKRGYLLYGPPGTGKTSLIAAIANLLEFDVYDLELRAVPSNTILRRLLASTTPKSVVVIEDADCSLDLSDRKKKKKKKNKQDEEDPRSREEEEVKTLASDGFGWSTVSLSGVLNFMDGLWSPCVGERLMIFTTNHPERLDEAMLRAGRMDRKIHLSYCGPAAFRILARNYVDAGEDHPRMQEAETLLGEVEMTPADIAEVLMRCDSEGEGTDAAMYKVVEVMRRRKEQAAAAAAAAAAEAEAAPPGVECVEK